MSIRVGLLCVVLASCFFGSMGLAAAEEGEPRYVDLPDAISLALVRSPQIDAAQLASQKAALKVDQAGWGWTPKFELSSVIAPQPKADASDTDLELYDNLTSWGVYTKNELSMVIPIFTSFKLSTAEELAEIGLDVEQLREEEARLQVTYDVMRAFYGIQLANALKVVSNESNDLVAQVDREYQKLADKNDGSVKKTDKYRIEMASSDVAIGAAEVDKMTALAIDGLRVHTGLEGAFTVPKMRFKPDELVLKSWEEVRDLAREKRLDLRQLAKALEASRTYADLKWLNWWPDFYVAAQVSLSYSSAAPDIPEALQKMSYYIYDPYNSFGAGALLGMKWKLDPVNQTLTVEEAQTDADRVAAQQKLAKAAAELEVEQHYLNAITAQKQVELTKKSRRSAKRLMMQELVDYQVGGQGVKDAISGVKGYTEQRVAYLMSLFNFRVALARLQLSCGAESIDELLGSGTLEDFGEAVEEDDSE